MMAVTVRFPAMLHGFTGHQRIVSEPVNDVAALLDVLERMVPGLAQKLADPIYNIAVNDELLLHRVRIHPLKDGDTVEIVPTISGG